MTTRQPPEQPHGDIARAIVELTAESKLFREDMYGQMRGALSSLHESVEALTATTKDLHIALTGDELGNPGIVHRQSDLQGQLDEERKERREADKRIHVKIDKIYKWLYVAIGVGIASGIGAAEIIQRIVPAPVP